MMRPLTALLKTCVSMTCSETRVNAGDLYRGRGIGDFLVDVSTEALDAKGLASRFLAECCHGNSHLDHIVCLVAINFLDTVLQNRPQTDGERQQRLRDCLAVSANPGTYDEIRKWADSWF